MNSLNTDVNDLHAAFCKATDREMPLNPTTERWWWTAIQYGVTPEMVADVMASRMKGNYTCHRMRLHCLSITHAIGSEERLTQLLDEAAQIAASRRKKVYSPGRREVLEQTGRTGEPDPPKVRHVSEVDWKSAVDGMRKAT